MHFEKRLMVIDDEPTIREGIRRIFEAENFVVEALGSGQAALMRLNQESFDLVITDLKMPGMSGLDLLRGIKDTYPDLPVVFITGFSSVGSAVEIMKMGAVDYIAKPFDPEDLVKVVNNALEQRVVDLENLLISKGLRDSDGFDAFIGKSPEMIKVYRRIMQVAPTDSTVLISGESGTGKELVARSIHKHSHRRDHPFVAVDCTALVENLLESELFGHVKGSFTGAMHTKTGLFKVAEGGTLFLDEVSNLSVTTQAKLLRVLQERHVTPIGGTNPIPINIRLVAATNRNLRDMVAEGTFREDLFFRLNIIPLDLPPLRERSGDIQLIVGSAVRRCAEELGKDIKGVTSGAMQLLKNYTFPGNVRELENIIERAVVLAESSMITTDDLELNCQGEDTCCTDLSVVPISLEELKETKRQLREQAVVDVERAFVLNALHRNNSNITKAAEETGMLRPNFQALMKKLGISARDIHSAL